ncbi:MAG: GNAT family N-acetyltransferase [Candidatus Rokubacteria bacterium]|nr:GNAT family N-acetyltransferase [Candidatus Rokubacteria bacterium]
MNDALIADKRGDRIADGLHVRRHEGRGAMRDLVSPLRSAGLLPAPLVEMEPFYLADGPEERPGMLVAYRDDQPVAYLPYALRRTAFRIAIGPTSLGRFPCGQLIVFGYVGFREDDASILDGFLASLMEIDAWDVLQVFELPADNALARYVRDPRLARRRGGRAVCRTYDTIHVVLEREFETYLQRQFTRKTRYNLRREVRRLDEAAPGQVAVKVYTSVADVPEFLRHAETIARTTYQRTLGFATLHATESVVRRTTALAAHASWRSYVLFVQGVPAAYCHGTVRWDSLSYDLVGYDPRFARLNPGKVLLHRILEDLHEWRGIGSLEFGRGAAEYKRLFANGQAVELDATIYRARPYAQTLRWLAAGADAGYRRLRPLVRPCLPYVKRGIRGLAVRSVSRT